MAFEAHLVQNGAKTGTNRGLADVRQCYTEREIGLTNGTNLARFLLRIGTIGLAAIVVCYSGRGPALPRNLAMVERLPAADIALPAMSTILGDEDQASRTLQAARLVFRHFVYDVVGKPREPIPRELAKMFESNVGQCDTAARLFAQLRADDGDRRFRQFDMLFVHDRLPEGATSLRRIIGGHSIAAMESPVGSIGVDPTFGLLFVSTSPKLTVDVLRRQNYKLYRLYDTTPSYDVVWPGNGLSALRMMTNADSDAAFTGNPMHVVSAPIPLRASYTEIGSIDDSSDDMEQMFGSWLGHLGWYYSPAVHRWNFESRDDGEYTFVFRFAPGPPNTLAADEHTPRVSIATTGTATLRVPQSATPVALVGDMLEITVHAEPGNFAIVVSTNYPASRKIDAIEVYRKARVAGDQPT